MTERRLYFFHAALALLLPVLMIVAAATPVRAQDTTDFFLRLNRLENQVRELSGTIEKLEFENRRLQEQLRLFQEDAEFRFQELEGGRQKRSDVPPEDVPPEGGPPGAQAAVQTTTPASPASSLQSSTGGEAAASPRSAGETAVISEAATGSAAPAHIEASIVEERFRQETFGQESFGQEGLGDEPVGDGSRSAAVHPGRPLDLSAVATASRLTTGDSGTATPIPSVAATAPGDPRASYEEAAALMRRQEYAQAEMGFRQFLQSHPRDGLAADATFSLGESYFFRGRYREAAEQYLKLSTTYASSPRVPEGMLKLGMSLEALGARDQACATFSETARKFPNASADVKAALSRVRTRANCV